MRLYHKAAGSADLADWPAIELLVRPAAADPLTWDPIWAQFTTQAGPTWGGYVRLMADAADQVRARSGRFYSARDVFASYILELFGQSYDNLRGLVYLQDTEHPLAGATVWLTSVDNPSALAVETKPDGSFSELIPAGTYTVTVLDYLLQDEVVAIVPATGGVDLDLVVTEGGRIGGLVADGAGNHPVAEVVVAVTDASGRTTLTRSDVDGRYQFGGLPAGDYAIGTADPTWAPLEALRVAVSSGQTHDGIDLLLVAGRVRAGVGGPRGRRYPHLGHPGGVAGSRRLGRGRPDRRKRRVHGSGSRPAPTRRATRSPGTRPACATVCRCRRG